MRFLLSKLMSRPEGFRRLQRIGRDRVRVDIGAKTIVLQGEICKDHDGYFITVAAPLEMVWHRPKGEAVSEAERPLVLHALMDRSLWPRAERFEI